MRRATAIAVFATLVGMVFGLGSVSADSTRPTLKNYQHAFVIMMENTGYDALIGNPNAPWINDAAGRYGLATNYRALFTRASRTTSLPPPGSPAPIPTT